MKKLSKKTSIIAIMMLLIILLSNFTAVSHSIEKTRTDDLITITATDLFTQTQSNHVLTKEAFFELFNPTNMPDTNVGLIKLYKEKLEILTNNNIVSTETATFLTNNIVTLQERVITNDIQPKGALFDVINLFNGLFFALKGEKTSSFLDLPVYQFPFFNDNITALFSGFSRYSGNGFIFTLGTLGFQYAYDYNPDTYDFPYFPSVSGSIIGFTGVLLEANVGDSFGPQYEGFYSIGIGMNIFTLWNLQ